MGTPGVYNQSVYTETSHGTFHHRATIGLPSQGWAQREPSYLRKAMDGPTQGANSSSRCQIKDVARQRLAYVFDFGAHLPRHVLDLVVRMLRGHTVPEKEDAAWISVSYTHLTLPTICSV
eukprot:15459730-Alexandrium_andersonii.AAC.1